MAERLIKQINSNWQRCDVLKQTTTIGGLRDTREFLRLHKYQMYLV